MINILIVDDSKTEAEILKHIISQEDDLHVIGWAQDGEKAIDLVKKLKPDLITMDIQMPIMDGFAATRYIMTHHPLPIVVISSKIDNKELNITYNALNAGALCVLNKPVNINSPLFDHQKKYITDMIRSMSEIKILKKRFFTPKLIDKEKTKPYKRETNELYQVIAIGCSVGGPQALKTIFEALPSTFPLPILVVQHMTHGFIEGFSKWLDQNISLKVKNAEKNEVLQKGTIYFAPDDTHLLIKRRDNVLLADLANDLPISGFRPSATYLLNSVAKVCGKNAIGILLTGMGEDGAKGLLEMKKAHAHTLIQDKTSAVVFGMPGVAQSLGAVDKVIQLEQMANYLVEITK